MQLFLYKIIINIKVIYILSTPILKIKEQVFNFIPIFFSRMLAEIETNVESNSRLRLFNNELEEKFVVEWVADLRIELFVKADYFALMPLKKKKSETGGKENGERDENIFWKMNNFEAYDDNMGVLKFIKGDWGL